MQVSVVFIFFFFFFFFSAVMQIKHILLHQIVKGLDTSYKSNDSPLPNASKASWLNAPLKAVWSGSSLFAQICLSQFLVY